MMRQNPKIVAAVISVGVYLSILSLILYYFNYRNTTKPVHYVKKNSNRIAVSLSSAPVRSDSKTKSKKADKPIVKEKKKSKPKKVRNITAPKSKPKTKSKKADKPVKKIKAKELFASVKQKPKTKKATKSKPAKKATKTASQRVAESLKKSNNSDKGIENAYIASVEERLRGWPAQSNFAGEQISVQIRIRPSGSFRFKVLRLSNNSEFNRSLIAYLKQLQSIGLDPQTYGNPYEIDVNFVATE